MLVFSVAEISDITATPENGIRLLLSVFAAYLLGVVHHHFISKTSSTFQHFYFIISSSCLYYWNYAFDIYHAYLCIFVQWILLQVLGGSMFCVVTSFIFQMTYLVWGYYKFTTDDYDINWLMPHCVLTLRLIGLAFDVYDGHKDEKYVSKEQLDRKISDKPGLLEIFGFSFFPSGFLVGPQFPLMRVRRLVDGTLIDSSISSSERYKAAFHQLFLGLFFLGVHTYLASSYSTDFYMSQQFKELTYWQRSGFVAIAGYLTLLRYVVVWMINEGCCIIIGIGYNRDEKTGRVSWDAVRNARIWDFLFCTSFQGLINCFNLNTNDWVLRYIFKRLKFMGNKYISHFSTLFFLAVWHGVHSGYFTCFAYEFLVITAEKPFRALLEDTSIVKQLRSSSLFSWVPTVVGFVYFHALCGYALIDFTMLKWHRCKVVLDLLYWQGHVVFIIMYVIGSVIVPMMKKKSETTEKKGE